MLSNIQKIIENQNAVIDDLDKKLDKTAKVVDKDVTLFFAALPKEHLESFFDVVRKYHEGGADTASTQQKIHELTCY